MHAVLSRVKEYAEVHVFQTQGYKGCSPEERRERYLEQRYTPIRYAEPLHVWGLGIGMVVQGAFTGWEIGLADGGIGGLLIALMLVSLLYFFLAQILSELASTIPFAGGMFSYSRVALGPWIGFFTGLSENLQYIFILSIYTIGCGSVFQIVIGMNTKAGHWIGVIIALAIMFVAVYLHTKGTQQLIWKVTVALAIFNVLLVLIFVLTVAKYANFCLWGVWNSDGSVGGDAQQQCKNSSHELGNLLFPKGGFSSVVYNIPAAFWMYIGMESVVITGEEVKKPTESVSKGIRAVFWTVCLYSPPVLILGSIVPPGALDTSYEIFPYMATLSALFNPNLARLYMAVFYLPCYFSMLNTTLYVLSRQSFALSRAGNFPKFLSITDPVTHRPTRCLIVGSLMSVILSVGLLPSAKAYTIVSYMVNVASLLVYPTTAISFVVLRIRLSLLDRPYTGRAGLFGAAYIFFFCIFSLISVSVYVPAYREALYVQIVLVAVGMAFYVIFRKRMQLWFSLEDEFIAKKLMEQASKDNEWRKAGLDVEAERNKKRLLPQLAFILRGGRVSMPSPESYIYNSPTPRSISCQPLPHSTALSTSSSCTSTSPSPSLSSLSSPHSLPSPSISLSQIATAPSIVLSTALPTSPSPSLPSLSIG